MVNSSSHLVVTALIGMVVTALCCYAFYVFRTGSAREQSLTDAMKVIRAATEIVASMAEKGLPSIRGRLEDLESRGRMIERRIGEGSGLTSTVASSHANSQDEAAAMLAARKAARAASAV